VNEDRVRRVEGGVMHRTRQRRRTRARPTYDDHVPMRSRSLVPLLAVGVVLSMGLTACGASKSTGITTGTVSKGSVAERVEAPGSVTARSVVTVTSPASGTIGSLKVIDGARVRPGQTLLVIDSPSAQKALSDAQSAASRASSGTTPTLSTNNLGAALKQADATANQAFAATQRAIDALPPGAAKVQAQAGLAQAKVQYATTRAQVQTTNASLNASLKALSGAVGQLTSAQQTQADLAV
jgi:HlyD family secretion protein